MYIISYAVVSWNKDNAKQRSSKSWIRNVSDLSPRNTSLEELRKIRINLLGRFPRFDPDILEVQANVTPLI
jgi:hypothetical protein